VKNRDTDVAIRVDCLHISLLLNESNLVICAHYLGGRWVSRSASLVAEGGIRAGMSAVLGRNLLVSILALFSAPSTASRTSVELCVIIDHEHYLPLKDVAVDQATAYA
jgi:hypothetical protein